MEINMIKIFEASAINYADVLSRCTITKIDIADVPDVTIIIPVRHRMEFFIPLLKYLRVAMNRYPLWKYNVVVVEHSIHSEYTNTAKSMGYNCIWLPGDVRFNKCLCMNIGAIAFPSKYYLFHDVDLMMKCNFFEGLAANDKIYPAMAKQAFSGRRVFYCNPQLTNSILNGSNVPDRLTHNMPGIKPGTPGAPGGSIFVSTQQFINVGGYDAETFDGYSIEDQFFHDKLKMTCNIVSCDTPIIDLYHLNHDTSYQITPEPHFEIYKKWKDMSVNSKLELLKSKKNHILKYVTV